MLGHASAKKALDVYLFEEDLKTLTDRIDVRSGEPNESPRAGYSNSPTGASDHGQE
jgi:hypothetical protein